MIDDYDYLLVHTYSCLTETLSSKGCSPTLRQTLEAVGGSLGAGTEITHFGLDQPPVFFSV